ncbi:hypothetical protein [Streptomyces sp. NPDC046909]|uniref:hypothetical protein n=1 Tax=Streptomyces sp. NPDC046909 TaxID=3155617 RepID=UPI0033C60EEB
MEQVKVRALALPAPILEGRWRHPGDAALAGLLPWFEDPIDFLRTPQEMERESRSLDMFADDPPSAELFREVRGSSHPGPVELPWLDVEQAVLIAVNRRPGDDVALALDYRTCPADPRVVGSDFWTNPRQCAWREAAPTFSSFVDALGL